MNPVAGIGGPAGLVSSDGAGVQRRALARGGVKRAEDRAGAALRAVAAVHPGLEVVTAAGAMGEHAVRDAGLTPRVVHRPERVATDGTDTTRAVAAFREATLVLFAGGDGTARDVVRGLRPGTAVLGIPAGVKMYSECFALGPAVAGAVAAEWVTAGRLPTRDAEVLDLDEARLHAGRPDPHLFALVAVPALPRLLQTAKAPTPSSESAAVRGAAIGAVRAMQPEVRYLLGPGGTLAEVARELGVGFSPLGVDVVENGGLLRRGASERELLEVVHGHRAQAVVTIIGGQGFLLGRGNQQLSPAVLRLLGDDPLLVVATEQKLIDLAGRFLLVDTGDAALDARLAGYVRVITGPSTESLYRVETTEGANRCA